MSKLDKRFSNEKKGPKVQTTIMIHEPYLVFIMRLGKGNKSKGIERLFTHLDRNGQFKEFCTNINLYIEEFGA